MGTKGTKEIATNWPNEEGLTAGTNKLEGRQMNLVPEEGSTVSQSERVGF